jgi:protoporphyrinogen oxidase
VFEAADRPGGLATWTDYGPFVWDRFYHVITPGDTDLVALCEEIGLGPKLVWRPTHSAFLWRGRHVPMSSYREFLTFPALSPWAKLRLGLGLLRAMGARDAAALERTPAARWIPRVFGESVWRRTFEPLLESKFGVLAPQVPASLLVATIRRNLAMRRRSDGSERLGYLRGGYRTFFTRLVERIGEFGGEVRLGAKVESIGGDPRAAEIRSSAGTERFARVVSTVPDPLFRRLAARVLELPREIGGRPEFLGVVCLVLVLRRALSRFYLTYLTERDLPFTGVVEYSALADPETDFARHHLVYLPRYLRPDDPLFERPDGELVAEGLDALARVWPEVRRWLVSAHVHRARHVQAIWLPGTRPRGEPPLSSRAPVESLTAERVGQDTLNNNAIVRLVNAETPNLLARLG